jgi:hypothetical protein
MKKEKILLKLLAVLTAVALIVSALPMLGLSARADYTYTVRLYTGAQGTWNQSVAAGYLANLAGAGATIEYKSDEIIIRGIPAANPDDSGNPYRVIFSENMVTRTNQKYLVRGLRESGKDNNTINKASFPVDRDMDLVVGYYMANGAVSYTIYYVDVNGNPLQAEVPYGSGNFVSEETHYGNAGEQLVLAFPYIENYTPRAYNGRITLSSNAADNVFYFPYYENPQEEETTTSTEAETTTAANAVGTTTAAQTDAQGNPVTPSQTDAQGNPVTPSGETDAQGNPVNPSAETDEQGNPVTPSGSEAEPSSSAEESASASESESAGPVTPPTPEEEIEIETSSIPLASTDFPEESTEDDGKITVQKILDVIRKPGFIFGSLGGLTGLTLLILLLVKLRKNKKNGQMNVEEKDDNKK